MARNLAHLAATWAAIFLLTIAGCHDDAKLLQGGTAGNIRLRDLTPADLQVNVFEDRPAGHRLAYGVSNSQGDFSLIADDGQEPYLLAPGNYRITLESIAADSIPVPRDYRDVRTTPLKPTWATEDTVLQIHVH